MIVVNDGTNSNASPCPNSYVSLQEMRTFWENRNDSIFTASPRVSTAVLDAALLYAVDYLSQKYRMRWIGSKVEPRQCMEWPREWAAIRDYVDFPDGSLLPLGVSSKNKNLVYYTTTEIPEALKRAQIFLARAAIADDGLSASQLVGVLDRSTKREKLGELEVEYFNAQREKFFFDASREVEILLTSQRGTWERG
ncbi:MAG: hypothetical protein NXH95_02540 [Pseudomonadaceae bacterium]|nr:hypothetical protein [Pseudomonadaceae bacterium]